MTEKTKQTPSRPVFEAWRDFSEKEDESITYNVVNNNKAVKQMFIMPQGLSLDVNIHQNEIALDGLHLAELYDSIPWKISMIIRYDRKEERAIRSMIEFFL